MNVEYMTKKEREKKSENRKERWKVEWNFF